MPPRWVRVLVPSLCLLGLAVAAYLTYEHYTGSTTLACSENGVVNCHAVTTSSYSEILGIPVTVLGLVFFVVMGALSVPPSWGRSGVLDRLRLAGSGVGVLMVLYLIWAELFALDRICLWCTAVHVITIVLFAVLVLTEAVGPARR